MSKLSFRARALDAAKPLPVYRDRDLPDLNDCVSINRAVPQMPTGMEKEEESEHHLQRAISAQQVFREKKESMVIPVPEAESNITYYDRLYKGECCIPKQLFHIQPFSLDNEHPDYDMDSEDETLLNRLNRKMEIKPSQFEIMVDRLEKASANQLVSLQEAKLLLNEDDYLLKSVYDYWVRKRKNCRGPSLIPLIKLENRDGSTNNDPYVAFRRRTEKMQTRKNRKNDEASYEKMLKLRREFSTAVTILEMIKRREKSKRELLHLTLEVVEKRYQIGDFGGEIINQLAIPRIEKSIYTSPISLPHGNRHKTENKTKRPHHISVKDDATPVHRAAINKRDIKQYDFHSSGDEDYPQVQSPASEPDEENDPDGLFGFRRKAGCQYYAPREDRSSSSSPLWERPPEELAGQRELRLRHCLTALSVPRRCVGLARRRVGRGGRVIMDRASSEHDRVLKRLDPEAFASGGGRTDPPAWTSTSGALPEKAGSLAEILHNIRTCRWRCFRPRPAPVRDSGDDDDDVGGTGRKTAAVPSDRLPDASAISPNAPKNPSLGGITEEQFLTHQQQLAQMQKQQLAQLRQKPPSQHASLPVRLNAQVPGPSGRAAKTLDSASAHFAASAVISAPGPGAAGASRDSRTHGASVNGVLQTSGTSKPLHSTSSTVPPSVPVQLLRTSSAPGASSNQLPALCPNAPPVPSGRGPPQQHQRRVPRQPAPRRPRLGSLTVCLKAGHRRRHRTGEAPQSHPCQWHRQHGQREP
ncbi:hypothetical protein SKAU_G00230670 [Synaphobranchus kaupii]|uniref:Enhancer of polycomb homolog n=1 Tax=Synaphobranchus kaupii TaxID=118154 RepID=A0A9Q1F608_SYNKA|nr:hypothetical protein SKAU_G00230670 [Synaphobranchus kaupii]